MQIKQWEDKNLAHFSYGILSDCDKKLVLIDPARDPQPYITFAKENDAEITGVIETHPHADFISSHLELHLLTGAPIYAGSMVEAAYPHEVLDDGDTIIFGKIKLSALFTPGHSPDSISVLLTYDGKQHAIFTGDTLFIGDCGRPDLRNDDGDANAAADMLARKMYHSLRDKFMALQDTIIVYPAHGAGTLCGKSLSKAKCSTIGEEKKTNWSLQEQTEDEFVNNLLAEQPFVPAYFSFAVELNKKGAPPFKKSVDQVKAGEPITPETLQQINKKNLWVVDVRDGKTYKHGHLHQSINLMDGEKFETWLGSIIQPGEHFYLVAKDAAELRRMIERTAAIGYEAQVQEGFVIKEADIQSDAFNLTSFKEHENAYTIIDVRNSNEVEEQKIFNQSINIPLPELRDRVNDIATDKPIVVHCASGYRSAAGSSMLQSMLKEKVKVFDLSDAVKAFR